MVGFVETLSVILISERMYAYADVILHKPIKNTTSKQFTVYFVFGSSSLESISIAIYNSFLDVGSSTIWCLYDETLNENCVRLANAPI